MFARMFGGATASGFLTQAGQLLNTILLQPCQSYDFDVTKNTYQFNFNASQINLNGQAS